MNKISYANKLVSDAKKKFASTQSSVSSQASSSSSVRVLRRQFTVQFKLMAIRKVERLESIRKAKESTVSSSSD